MKKKFLLFTCLISLMLSAGCKNEITTSNNSTENKNNISSEDSSENNNVSSNNESSIINYSNIDSSDDDSSSNKIDDDSSYFIDTSNPVPVDNSIFSNRRPYFSNINTVASNEELKKCLDELETCIDKLGYNLSFSYENPNKSTQINFNSEKKYETCSTIKAPFVKNILENNTNLDEMIPINYIWTDAEIEEGMISYNDVGKSFPAKDLIERTILLSDNSAYYNLVAHYGHYKFNQMQNSIGANYTLGLENTGNPYIFTYCNSSDLLKSYKDIYNFAENNENGKWLIELLANAVQNEQIGKKLSKKYTVAQKYGTDASVNNYHDAAIVYADSPFILCIMTEQIPETEESNKIFIELADIFDRLNTIIID